MTEPANNARPIYQSIPALSTLIDRERANRVPPTHRPISSVAGEDITSCKLSFLEGRHGLYQIDHEGKEHSSLPASLSGLACLAKEKAKIGQMEVCDKRTATHSGVMREAKWWLHADTKIPPAELRLSPCQLFCQLGEGLI